MFYILTRIKPRPFQGGASVLTVIVRSISVCLDVYSVLRIPKWPSARKELSAMWVNLIYTGLCRQTKFMYGINDSVHTALSLLNFLF